MSTTFWEVIWYMVVFFFWFMFIWTFIRVFADIFRRNDISGWAKAGWLILLIVLPLIGCLIYLIARPRMTEQDRQALEEYEERQRRVAGFSAADEIAKAQELKDKGAITEDEFQVLKRRAIG